MTPPEPIGFDEMTHRSPLRATLFLGVIAHLTCLLGVANASVMVSEGVSFSAASGQYTYHYAVDNRDGTDAVISASILVVPFAGLNSLPALEHTSPQGWVLLTSTGGSVVTPGPAGTFQSWYKQSGVAPGEYLSGFSLTTVFGPRNPVGPNYVLVESGGTTAFGTVPGPELPPYLPLPVPTLPSLSYALLFFTLAWLGMWPVAPRAG